jgi:dolichol-phosphate mannosyltransferase
MSRIDMSQLLQRSSRRHALSQRRTRLNVSIVVPTFCEAENLETLTARIDASLKAAGLGYEIIIVDDASPDRTADVVQGLKDRVPIRLIVRQDERGLSSAVLEGVRAASGDTVVVMDADLSHPPEKIPELVSALTNGRADFAIGSRYVSGGSTADDWGLMRWVNSKVATWLARPLTRLKDPMAGFFAISRRRAMDASGSYDPIGYKIGLEMLVKCNCRKPAEIPIHFSNRLHGESKLSLKEQLRYLQHIKRLLTHRYGSLFQFAQFLLVGTSGMAVDLAAFAILLNSFSLDIARALAILVAMTWNFVWNRAFVFEEGRERSLLLQYLLFCGSCTLGAVINWTTALSLCYSVSLFANHPVLAAAFGAVAGAVSNFVISKHVVFGGRQSS